VLPLSCAALLALAGAASAADAQQPTFATPEAAVDALVTAARSDDAKALLSVIGEDAAQQLSSGDDVADATARERFVDEYDEAHELVEAGDAKYLLEVGNDAWELPFPIVKTGDKWTFDVDEGIDEIVYRRIGRNEIGAMETCRGIVEAQRMYASESRDGGPEGIYAQKLLSDPGKHNGLYWAADPDERASPIGPFIAQAASEGYRKSTADKPAPYHGYVYKLLTSQGPAAEGGAKNYLKNGQLTDGFAVIAYPVEYQSSGVETFMISHDGVLYQKDLGAKTAEAAAAIKTFNPDSSWSKVD
jgi:hypothetical protein